MLERVVRVVDSTPMPKRERFVRLVSSSDAELERAPKQRAVIDFLSQRARLAPVESGGLVPLTDVLARTGTDRATVTALARAVGRSCSGRSARPDRPRANRSDMVRVRFITGSLSMEVQARYRWGEMPSAAEELRMSTGGHALAASCF